MEKLETNILLIGKSGTGKSSLLNYMFGEDLHKTGTGSATTPKGLFPEEYAYGERFFMRIYDTWGLEAGKDDEWEQLIFAEVEAHEKHHIREWFSTVLLCISANAERLEDFERNLIVRFATEWKTHVTVVITHCKNEADERALRIREEICRAMESYADGMTDRDVVFVNSVEKKLIGQKNAIVRFGREEVFVSIVRNLWNAFKIKVPFKVRRYVNRKFMEQEAEFAELINGKKWFLRKVRAIEELEAEINEKFEAFIRYIVEDTNAHFNEATQYYQALCKTYVSIGLSIDAERFVTSELKFHAFDRFEQEIRRIMDNFKETGDWLNTPVSFDREGIIVMLAEVRAFLTGRKRMRKELIRGVKKYLEMMKESLYQQIDKVQNRILALDFSEVT